MAGVSRKAKDLMKRADTLKGAGFRIALCEYDHFEIWETKDGAEYRRLYSGTAAECLGYLDGLAAGARMVRQDLIQVREG